MCSFSRSRGMWRSGCARSSLFQYRDKLSKLTSCNGSIKLHSRVKNLKLNQHSSFTKRTVEYLYASMSNSYFVYEGHCLFNQCWLPLFIGSLKQHSQIHVAVLEKLHKTHERWNHNIHAESQRVSVAQLITLLASKGINLLHKKYKLGQ